MSCSKRFLILSTAVVLLLSSQQALAHREAADDDELTASLSGSAQVNDEGRILAGDDSEKDFIEIPFAKSDEEPEYTGPKDFNYCNDYLRMIDQYRLY